MNLICEEIIKQSNPTLEFARTDKSQVVLTLHGRVQDPAMLGNELALQSWAND